MTATIIENLEKLNQFVKELDLHEKSGPYTNNDVQDYAKKLAKVIRTNPDLFKQAIAEHPKYMREWKENIAQRTSDIQGGKGFTGGIKRALFGSSTEKALVKVNKLFDSVFPPKDTAYDMQLIWTHVADIPKAAHLLERKGRQNGLQTHTITSGETDKEKLDIFKKVTHGSRIYIVGHGRTSGLSLKSSLDSGKPLSTKEIAAFLAIHAPQLIKKETELQGEKPIKISLVACYSSHGREHMEVSFAEALSIALCEVGIPAEVIGRNSTVRVEEVMDPNNRVAIQKLTDRGTKHKDPNSKTSFISKTNSNGSISTTIKDVYSQNDAQIRTRNFTEIKWINHPWRNLKFISC